MPQEKCKAANSRTAQGFKLRRWFHIAVIALDKEVTSALGFVVDAVVVATAKEATEVLQGYYSKNVQEQT